MGGWVAYILQNLESGGGGDPLIPLGWDAIEYEAAADTLWIVEPEMTRDYS